MLLNLYVVELHVVQIKNPQIYMCDLSLLLRVAQQAGHPHKCPLQLQSSGTPSTIYKPNSHVPNNSDNSIFSPEMCLPQNPVPDGTQAAAVVSVLLCWAGHSDLRPSHRGNLHQQITFVKESSQLTSGCGFRRF